MSMHAVIEGVQQLSLHAVVGTAAAVSVGVAALTAVGSVLPTIALIFGIASGSCAIVAYTFATLDSPSFQRLLKKLFKS